MSGLVLTPGTPVYIEVIRMFDRSFLELAQTNIDEDAAHLTTLGIPEGDAMQIALRINRHILGPK